MPKNLMRSCRLIYTYENGERVIEPIENNRNPLLLKRLDKNIVLLEITAVKSWSKEKVGVFSCDIVTD